MANIEAYLVRLRRPSKILKPFIQFGAIGGKHTFAELLGARGKQFSNNLTDLELNQKCLKIKDLEVDQQSCRGRILAGEYGYSNEIVDAKKKATSHLKTKNEAELLPFYFEFWLPKAGDAGLLLVQRLGRSGVKGLIETFIAEPVAAALDKRVTFAPIMPEAALKRMVKGGRIASVQIVSHEIPSDIADIFNGSKKPEQGTFEWVLRPRGNGKILVDKFLDFLNSKNKKLKDHIKVSKFDYQTIKAEIDVGGGRKRKINFGNMNNIKATFDVSEDVSLAPDGYPTFNSLKSACSDILDDIAAGTGISR